MGTREMAPDRTTSATRAPALRSAVTNGTRVFLTRGGELSVVGRRWKDLYLAIVVDRGGAGQLSEGQRQLARRIATLAVEAEILVRLAAGERLPAVGHDGPPLRGGARIVAGVALDRAV